ncbi:sugar ABC transporter substrate-binding protein [Acidisoma cellulosilytica]|uniref:Sugar ABC transporter substrate-binding protein n=1 Tax=Acidisoma cellulosilyticum TaxID=2802395 RepID=A0A964E515_9PROT|nr:sugar ABC transporter substrate-binding protein [Acidisoma cellulosilyticum]MCB8881523.1 sugar ABC transporter substrate-binding protein [Acidisoma cellulosilyticum]
MRHGLLVVAGIAAIAAFHWTDSRAFAEDKGEIVYFLPSSTNPYIGQMERGAKAKAAESGYAVKFLENNFNQAEQNAQVQQQLASGEKVAGYVWYPFDNAAGVGAMRALSRTGVPVVVTNQLPLKGTEKFFTAYAGASDDLSGKTAGEMLLAACAHSATKCDAGAIIRFPAGVSAGDDRVTGFENAIKGKLTVISVTPADGFLEDSGYKVASQIIPAEKSKITWVYTENDSMAGATAQAARENGLIPGKNIFIIGGTCHGDSSHVVNGDLIGTAIQSGYFEGWLAVQTLVKYIKTDVVLPGSVSLPADPNTPPSDSGSPHKYNFLPNPPVGNSQAAYDQAKLWGRPAKELCNF